MLNYKANINYVITNKYYIFAIMETKRKSGRKPVAPEKKIIQVYYFIERWALDSVGLEKAKQIARNAVEQEAINLTQGR